MTIEEKKEAKSAPKSAAKEKPSNATKYIALAVVTMLLVALPIGYFMMNKGTPNKSKPSPVYVFVSGTSDKNITLAMLEGMQATEGETSYQNQFGNWRGAGNYRGVELSSLADQVGGMNPGDIMTITSKDGYSINLSYYQVYPTGKYLSLQGKIILAYEYNNTKVPAWTDGPMLAALPPDKSFSNEDMNATSPRDPEFAYARSAGALFAKYVNRLSISHVYNEWSLNLTCLDGNTTKLTRTDFVKLRYFNYANYTDSDGGRWEGARISALFGLGDDSDPTTFNATLARTYSAQFIATDGYNKSFVACNLTENGALVADRMNGSEITGKFYPLRLVCSALTKGEMVGALSAIKLTSIPQSSVALTIVGTMPINYTMDEIRSMPSYTGSGSFKKSTGAIMGPHTYKGVRVSSLVSQVWSGNNYSLEVESSDGYTMTYSSSQVNGTFAEYDSSGDVIGITSLVMLLAYEEIGANMSGGPLRIVLVYDDAPITDGHFWSKYVVRMTVKPYVSDWAINLTGIRSMQMDRQTFESLASCEYHRVSYSFTNETGVHVYEGVPLWLLVSAMDGADAPDGHYVFNSLLSEIGYNVTVYASDGFNATFPSSMIARNNSLVVAYKLDGEPLPESEFPLKIVGNLTGKQKVKKIVEIMMCNITSVPDWNLTLVGTRSVTIDSASFAALFYSGAHTAYYNYTSSNVSHSYAGIPLWVLIAMVDGLDLEHYDFNDTLASTNYTVKIIAGDGFNATLPIAQIARNDSIIVAFTLDGSYLAGDEAPLRLVGEYLTGSQEVKGLARIELIGV